MATNELTLVCGFFLDASGTIIATNNDYGNLYFLPDRRKKASRQNLV